MAQSRTYKTMMFAGPKKIDFQDIPPADLKPDEVRIETMFSGISRGTEMTLYRGVSPFLSKAFDPASMLFQKTDKPTWKYPMEFGYENVGKIIEVGSEVDNYSVGDIVFTPMHHSECIVINAKQASVFFGDLVPVLKLPKELKCEYGVFAPLLGVAYNTVLDAQLLLGESVVIFGAGVLGLLTTQLCRMAGAQQIFVVDPIASRRKLAEQFGATQTFDPTTGDDLSLTLRNLTEGRGLDVALEVSGAYPALHEAIRSVGYNGRVVVASYLAGSGEKLNLGEEFHHNRVRLIGSQSFGVHPNISDRWNPARRTLAVIAMLPKLEVAPMISHRLKFAEAAKAFELVDKKPDEVLQVILEYGR